MKDLFVSDKNDGLNNTVDEIYLYFIEYDSIYKSNKKKKLVLDNAL